ALIDELCRNDVAVADVLAVQVFFFIQDAERVPCSGIQNEVYDATENICHIHDGNGGNLRTLTRQKQAVYNIAFLEGGNDIGSARDSLDFIVVLFQREQVALEGGLEHFELCQFARFGNLEA